MQSLREAIKPNQTYLTYYDPTLAEWDIEFDGRRLAMGLAAKKSLESHNRTETEQAARNN